jgi:hypothetical protein
VERRSLTPSRDRFVKMSFLSDSTSAWNGATHNFLFSTLALGSNAKEMSWFGFISCDTVMEKNL